MLRPAVLRLLPCCLVLAALPGCKQTSFKLPKLKVHHKTSASTTGTVPDAAAPSVPVTVPGRTPEESAFLEKCKALGNSGTTITGRDGYLFSGTELQRLAQLEDPNAASIRTATAAIAHYHNQLKAKGIQLVFVPLPPKAVVFPDKIAKDLKIKIKGQKKPARLDSSLQAAYETLRAKGVRVIDPTDALLGSRENKKAGPIFPKTGPVWSPRAAAATAGLIAEGLKGAKWANQPGKNGPLISESATLSYTGPLTTSTAAMETLALRNIGRSADGKMRSVTFSQGGNPLALIGDSSLLAWREANNPAGSSGAFASLADQLAYELQTTPDLFQGKTDGRNAARQRILRETTNGRNPLSSTKVLVWVIQATDFALSDWKKVPLRLDLKLSAPPLLLAPPIGLIPDISVIAHPPASPPPAPAPPADPGVPELPR